MRDREEYTTRLEGVDSNDKTTARRIFQNLQIDGLKPTYDRVKGIIRKLRSQNVRTS